MSAIRLWVDESLLRFLPARRRRPALRLDHDGTASLGHVVQAAGVPLTEVGELTLVGTGVSVPASYRPRDADVVRVSARPRPQPAPGRYLLDVHLGSLARSMRLLGLDTGYSADAGDEQLVATALAQGRLLLTKDLGLLRRRVVQHQAAYVRGGSAGEQLADVLDRFAPPLDPWTRCPACNGEVAAVDKRDVAAELEPGTARSYDAFGRCGRCGRVYWRGARARRLAAVVDAAVARTPPGEDRR